MKQEDAPNQVQTGLVYGAVGGIISFLANLLLFLPYAANWAADIGLVTFALAVFFFFLAGRRAGGDLPAAPFAGAGAGMVAGVVYGILAGSLGSYLGAWSPYSAIIATLVPSVPSTFFSPGNFALQTASLAVMAGILGGAVGYLGSLTVGEEKLRK